MKMNFSITLHQEVEKVLKLLLFYPYILVKLMCVLVLKLFSIADAYAGKYAVKFLKYIFLRLPGYLSLF